MSKYIICQSFNKFHRAVFSIAHPKYNNTIQYNKLYLKAENIKHYNTSSNEFLNPTKEYAYINNKTKTCTQYLLKKNIKKHCHIKIFYEISNQIKI
jgi:hypothetical protein